MAVQFLDLWRETLEFDVALLLEERFQEPFRKVQVKYGGIQRNEHESRGHITLGIYPDCLLNDLLIVLLPFFSLITPFLIRFSAFSLFPNDPRYLSLHPQPSKVLMELQLSLCRVVNQAGLSIDELYNEDRWLPHCTLLRTAKPLLLHNLLEDDVVQPLFNKWRVPCVSVVSFDPYKEHLQIPLVEME